MRHLKQEFDKLTFKEALTYGLAIASMTAGFVLLFMGMLIEPRGEIHPSVLSAFGIILMFVGAVLGLEMRYANKSAQFKAEILEFMQSLTEQTTKKDTEK